MITFNADMHEFERELNSYNESYIHSNYRQSSMQRNTIGARATNTLD